MEEMKVRAANLSILPLLIMAAPAHAAPVPPVRTTTSLDRGWRFLKADASGAEKPASRWYAGAGIYRHVRLVATNAVHLEHRSTFVTTPTVARAEAAVHVRSAIVGVLIETLGRSPTCPVRAERMGTDSEYLDGRVGDLPHIGGMMKMLPGTLVAVLLTCWLKALPNNPLAEYFSEKAR